MDSPYRKHATESSPFSQWVLRRRGSLYARCDAPLSFSEAAKLTAPQDLSEPWDWLGFRVPLPRGLPSEAAASHKPHTSWRWTPSLPDQARTVSLAAAHTELGRRSPQLEVRRNAPLPFFCRKKGVGGGGGYNGRYAMSPLAPSAVARLPLQLPPTLLVPLPPPSPPPSLPLSSPPSEPLGPQCASSSGERSSTRTSTSPVLLPQCGQSGLARGPRGFVHCVNSFFPSVGGFWSRLN